MNYCCCRVDAVLGGQGIIGCMVGDERLDVDEAAREWI